MCLQLTQLMSPTYPYFPLPRRRRQFRLPQARHRLRPRFYRLQATPWIRGRRYLDGRVSRGRPLGDRCRRWCVNNNNMKENALSVRA